MTIQEMFETEHIYKDDLVLVSEESEYSRNAAGFVLDKWYTDIEDLTPKQAAWASRILDDLTERRISQGGIR